MLQALPLEVKVRKTELRIQEWVNEYGTDGVHVSFSGGKDSTVLLHIVRKLYPSIEAVYVNTGLEYPEIQKFVKTFDNVTILRPEMRFDEVVKKYGYPIASKRVSEYAETARRNPSSQRARWLRGDDKTKFVSSKWWPIVNADFMVSAKCCEIMKKRPIKRFEKQTGKHSIIATMASESLGRENAWLKNGCNAFDVSQPSSRPMSFWTEQDILQYIDLNHIPIASVYGDIAYNDKGKLYTTGCNRTGCIFCAFGCHLEKEPSRFQRLKETHPRQYEYCIKGGEYDEDGIWKPSKDGLGMGHVFDKINEIYGDGFIKY